MSIEFHSPENGEVIQNPDLEWLRDRVLNGGTDYWDGTVQTGIKFLGPSRNAQLVITHHAPDGFCLEHADVDHVGFVSLGRAGDNSVVTVYIGGEPLALPGSWFVPVDLAWEAIRQFSIDGTRTERIHWVKKRDQRQYYEETDSQ
jgi:hypothetical protein